MTTAPRSPHSPLRTAFRGRSYWANQTSDTTGITDHLNRVQKYVLSTTLKEPGWEPTTVLRHLDEVQALRSRPGRLGVTGCTSVTQQLVAADLVDEYRLLVYPVLVGPGAGVLAGTGRLDLDLVEATAFPSGITLLRYQRRR